MSTYDLQKTVISRALISNQIVAQELLASVPLTVFTDEHFRLLAVGIVKVGIDAKILAYETGIDLNEIETLSALNPRIGLKAAIVILRQASSMTEAPELDIKIRLLKSGKDLRAMDIKVEWVVDNLIPRHSVVLLYGRGGIGKTTLMMILANAIDHGDAIFGMATLKTQVIVVDFENSLAVLSERAKRTAVDGVLFWDSSTKFKVNLFNFNCNIASSSATISNWPLIKSTLAIV